MSTRTHSQGPSAGVRRQWPLGDEPGDERDDAAAERDAERGTGVLAGLGGEPAQELLGVFAVQLSQAGHLRVSLDNPGHQPAQRIRNTYRFTASSVRGSCRSTTCSWRAFDRAPRG